MMIPEREELERLIRDSEKLKSRIHQYGVEPMKDRPENPAAAAVVHMSQALRSFRQVEKYLRQLEENPQSSAPQT